MSRVKTNYYVFKISSERFTKCQNLISLLLFIYFYLLNVLNAVFRIIFKSTSSCLTFFFLFRSCRRYLNCIIKLIHSMSSMKWSDCRYLNEYVLKYNIFGNYFVFSSQTILKCISNISSITLRCVLLTFRNIMKYYVRINVILMY